MCVDLSQPSQGNRRHIHPFPWVLKLWTVKDFGPFTNQCSSIFANERPPANFLEMLAWSFSTLMCILFCLSWACQLRCLLDSLCKLCGLNMRLAGTLIWSLNHGFLSICSESYSIIIRGFLHSALKLCIWCLILKRSNFETRKILEKEKWS